MDGPPPLKFYLASKENKQSSRETGKVTFAGGYLILPGSEWTGPMKAYVAGWTSVRKYVKGTCSVQIAYKYSESDFEKLNEILASGKISNEEAAKFLSSPNTNVSSAIVKKIGKRKVVLIETKTETKLLKTMVTTGNSKENFTLLKIIFTDAVSSNGKELNKVLSTTNFVNR